MTDRPAFPNRSDFDLVAGLPEDEREALFHILGGAGVERLATGWEHRARGEQMPPPGDWTCWLVLAGRGFGKTRLGAEWVHSIARVDGRARIALIGASIGDARAVMVEGGSGVLAVAPSGSRPQWLPSRNELRWPGGARARLYGAAQPEALRGPEHSHVWADEIGKWPRAQACWDNAMMGLRLGALPRVLATTTPRSTALLRRLAVQAGTVVTRGRTTDNAAGLPAPFLAAMRQQYRGTRLGRQELDGELLTDVEGALWSEALLERCRATGPLPSEAIRRTVIGVDPPAGATGDACGIIVAALDGEGHVHVLDDASMERPQPEQWARRVVDRWRYWSADRIVAEANNGGAMVASVLRAVDPLVPVRLVHASKGKVARAEPVAVLYEARRVWHHGRFPALEAELCGLAMGGGYAGPGRSPDRADALVWAIAELTGGRASSPAVRIMI